MAQVNSFCGTQQSRWILHFPYGREQIQSPKLCVFRFSEYGTLVRSPESLRFWAAATFRTELGSNEAFRTPCPWRGERHDSLPDGSLKGLAEKSWIPLQGEPMSRQEFNHRARRIRATALWRSTLLTYMQKQRKRRHLAVRNIGISIQNWSRCKEADSARISLWPSQEHYGYRVYKYWDFLYVVKTFICLQCLELKYSLSSATL
jgi:hypothetical protein